MTIGIGIIGLGGVGASVARVLMEEHARIQAAAGIDYRLNAVGVRDLTKPRDFGVGSLLTDDIARITHGDDIQIVVEVAGPDPGVEQYLRTSLANGKHVVTANKAIIARAGAELFKEAERHGRELRFEASVAGAIPVIRFIREAVPGDALRSIFGIVNGTCNYILTRMEEGHAFEDALSAAQELHYAEADPSADIEGLDAKQKASILASLVTHRAVSDDVYCEGITKITKGDMTFVAKHGYSIKLIASIKSTGGEVAARVEPLLLPSDHPLASVSGVDNALYIVGDLAGPLLLRGAGAGGNPTSSAIIADVIDILRDTKTKSRSRIPLAWTKSRQPRRVEDPRFGYYLSVSTPNPDSNNCYARTIAILNSRHCLPQIVELQLDDDGDRATLRLMTLPPNIVSESEFRAARRDIEQAGSLGQHFVFYDPDIDAVK